MVDTRIEKVNENFYHKVCTIDFDKLIKKFNGDEKKIKNEIKQDFRDIFIDANRQKSPLMWITPLDDEIWKWLIDDKENLIEWILTD